MHITTFLDFELKFVIPCVIDIFTKSNFSLFLFAFRQVWLLLVLVQQVLLLEVTRINNSKFVITDASFSNLLLNLVLWSYNYIYTFPFCFSFSHSYKATHDQKNSLFYSVRIFQFFSCESREVAVFEIRLVLFVFLNLL